MSKKVLLIILIIINSLLFFSCYDFEDISKKRVVNSIGIDYDLEKKEFTVYYHLTSPSSLTTSELGGDAEESSFMIAKATGKNLYEPLKKINDYANENISLYHTNSFILSNRFMTYKNLNDFMLFINTNKKFFPDFVIFVTFDKIEEIYSLDTIEKTSTYFSLFAFFDSNSKYNFIKYSNMVSMIYEENLIISIPIIEVTKDTWKDEKKDIKTLRISGLFYLNENDQSLSLLKDDIRIINMFINKNNVTLIYNDYTIDFANIEFNVKFKKDHFLIYVHGIGYINNVINIDNKLIEDINMNIEKDFNDLILKTKDEDFDILSLNDRLYRLNKLKSGFNYKTTNIKYKFHINYY